MHSSSNCNKNNCDDNASAVTSSTTSPNSDAAKQACKKAGIPTNAGFSIMGDSISTLGGYIPQGWRCHYEGEVSIPGVAHLSDTWWGQVIEHFGGHLVGNASFSGSTVEGFGFPAGCSPKRAIALVGTGADVSASATNDSGENTGEDASEGTSEKPQVVLVFMGINDYGWGGAKNQVMGGSASRTAEPEALGGQAPVALTVTKEALQRFKQSYTTMLENIRAVAPDAQIWCLTLSPAVMEGFGSADENESGNNAASTDTSSTTNAADTIDAASAANAASAPSASDPNSSAANTTSASSAGEPNASTASTTSAAKLAPFIYSVRGIDLDEYNNAIRVCAAQAGAYAHVADIRSFNIDYESVDNTHPTARGMKQIAAMVCACMEGALTEDAKPTGTQTQLSSYPELTGAPKSQRHCEAQTCEGCPCSPLTSSSWCLACGKQ